MPLAWQAVHMPAPLPMLLLWFIRCDVQLEVLVWQALHSSVLPLSSCVTGMWLPGLVVKPYSAEP